MTGLDLCKFCGGGGGPYFADGIYWVACSACGASTRQASTPEAAKALWNRSPGDPIPAKVDPFDVWWFSDAMYYTGTLREDSARVGWNAAVKYMEREGDTTK